MQGAISNIEAVGRWFRANESPFYTLSYYSTQSATGQGQVIGRNIKDGDIDQAWDRLKTLIQDQTGYGRAQLHLLVYDKASGANTPSGRTNIDIVSNGSPQAQSPGIGSLPAGYVDEAKIQSMLDEREKVWKLERKVDDLEAQLAAPGDFWDKAIQGLEKIGNTTLGMAMASKILGAPPPLNGLNGTQTSDNAEIPDTDDFESELDDLEALATANGMTLKQFLAKTASLARQQPTVVAMLAQQQ